MWLKTYPEGGWNPPRQATLRMGSDALTNWATLPCLCWFILAIIFCIFHLWRLSPKFFVLLKTCPEGGWNPPGQLPFVWDATPLPTELFWLGFRDHIGVYILYIWVVALIGKVFLSGWKLALSGAGTHPDNYPSYGMRRPCQLSYTRLAFRIILAIIFCIFVTFFEIIKCGQDFVGSSPTESCSAGDS